MDIKLHHNTLKMLLRIFDSETSTIPCIQTPPQKASVPIEESSFTLLKRAKPEDMNIPSSYLCAMLKELTSCDDVNLQQLLLVKDGTVIYDASFGAYSFGIWRATHSLCKSVTSLAIGMLTDEGRLSIDDDLVSIFSGELSSFAQMTHKKTRVRHLLSMSVGSTFNEASIVASSDWFNGWFDSPVRFESGSQFYYNSINSYILSAIVRKITGQNLSEYLKPRLFDVLGITRYHWETCPKGIEKGGFGLYLSAEDMAKLGVLVCQNGRWNGKQVVSEKWINDATRAHISVPLSVGDYDYGYHMWCHRKNGSVLFNGMFGQNVFIYPDKDIVAVTLCGNDEVFQQSSLYSIINKYFSDLYPEKDVFRTSSFVPYRRLLSFAKKSAQKLSSLPAQYSQLCGKRIAFTDAKSAGILPIIVQIMQNNYTHGITSVSFNIDGDDFYVNITEGVATKRIPVGFGKGKITELDLGGESYVISTVGSFSADEDGNLVLKLRISFLELPNERIIRFYFGKNDVTMKMDEVPGVDFLRSLVHSATSEHSKAPISVLFSRLSDKIDSDYLQYRAEKLFSPDLKGFYK
ncbi:MAG: serine hydrolase [Ruminococcaceae bacterium]|nr:serine hydrolase [Oscillospiraceae bacterium]